MPIYEFVCPSCDHEFELIRSFSDDSSPICPNCAHAEVERQVGRPAIHFKGSGWYITDSKKASKSSANGPDSGAEPAGRSPDDGKVADSTSGQGAKSDSATKPDVNKPDVSKPVAKEPA